MENVSSSCLALVALCCADKRLLPSFPFCNDLLFLSVDIDDAQQKR